MKKRQIILFILSILAFTAILATGCSYFQNVRGLYIEEESGKAVAVGDYENDFTLKDLEGKEVSISDFSGDVVVLNFWATWCPPCRAEIPDFIQVYSDYRDRGVQFIGISNEDVSIIKDFVEDYGINYPILVDRSNIGGAWGIRAIPTTFVLDGSGSIVNKNVGLMTKEQLEAAIENALR